MGVGAIVNLQSNDGAKIWEMIPYLNFIWASPLQVRIPHQWAAHLLESIDVT